MLEQAFGPGQITLDENPERVHRGRRKAKATLGGQVRLAILASSVLYFGSVAPAWSQLQSCTRSECRARCGSGSDARDCMYHCSMNSDCAPERPTITFGAIAYSPGDGYTSKSMHAETSKEATGTALGHCRSNSGTPNQCTAATWYVNSCGALAVGTKTYAAVGGGNDAADLSLAEAQAAALAACRKSNANGNCKLVYSGCSDDLTPEEAAENERKKQAVGVWMGSALCAVLGSSHPACRAQSRTPNTPNAVPEKESESSIQAIRSLAAKGDPEAQFKLGLRYHKGDGVQQDYGEAFGWYGKAAEQDHVAAQTNLGAMYQMGQGLEKDPAMAAAWYGKAAAQGDADAQLNLGMLYHQGLGVKLDLEQAAYWYREAAAQGHAHAARMLRMLTAPGSP